MRERERDAFDTVLSLITIIILPFNVTNIE